MPSEGSLPARTSQVAQPFATLSTKFLATKTCCYHFPLAAPHILIAKPMVDDSLAETTGFLQSSQWSTRFCIEADRSISMYMPA